MFPPISRLYWKLSSGQIVGEHGGTAFPFRFRWGNAVPIAYTMTATYNTNACFKVTPIINRGNFKACIL